MANKSKMNKKITTNDTVGGKNEKIKDKRIVCMLLKLSIPILIAILVASLVHRNGLWLLQRETAALKKPDVLLNYPQFKALYPRLRLPKPLEESRRHLLFTGDLLRIGAHNINYLAGLAGHLARQMPFKADRTLMEQHDILGQLDEFNMTEIMLNFEREQQQASLVDSPVSFGAGGGSSSSGKLSNLKTGSKMGKWLKLTVQGDSHYEIPNYPLEAQPDIEKGITHIDADLRSCSGDIHNQGHCGACYAFSWLSLAEWHYCKQQQQHTKGYEQKQRQQKIDFSEQHLLDCGHLVGLTGCREGFLRDAKRFSEKFGFHLEQEYPYKGKQASVCKHEFGSIKVKVVEFTRIQVNRMEWEQILFEQPILLQVHLPSDIMSYHKGIHHGLNCDESKAHGMLLIGHGRENGQAYWILRNSMGSQWGENGYLRLARDAPINKCFRTGFVAKFKFESLDDEAYYDLYDSWKFQPSVHVINEKPPPTIVSNQARNWFNGNNHNNN